jgi:hypothetical protein
MSKTFTAVPGEHKRPGFYARVIESMIHITRCCKARLIPSQYFRSRWLFLWLLALVQSLAAQAQVAFGQLTYTNSENGMIVLGFVGAVGPQLVIPESINGIPVREIGEGAFAHTTITKAIVPDTVSGIGKKAFYNCTSLTEISLGSGVARLGDQAFEGCSLLRTILLPAGVKSIGLRALAAPGLEEVIVAQGSESYVTVDGVLFDHDRSTLIQYPRFRSGASYDIPEGVVVIGEAAFKWSWNLAQVTFPPSVTTIGPEAFSSCRILESLILGEGLVSIGNNAFEWNRALRQVNLGQNIRTIGSLAFVGCTALEEIYLPYQLAEIGFGAFASCSSLRQFLVDGQNPGYTAPDGVLCDKSVTALIQYPLGRVESEYQVPDSVVSIENSAFAYFYIVRPSGSRASRRCLLSIALFRRS